MRKLFNTILLSTALITMSCSDVHASAPEDSFWRKGVIGKMVGGYYYDETLSYQTDDVQATGKKILSIEDFIHQFNSIDYNIDESNGLLKDTDGKLVYYDGKPCYDTIIAATTNNPDIQKGHVNLIFTSNFQYDSSTQDQNVTLMAMNTNLIIPNGVTINTMDSTNPYQLYATLNDCSNCNILVFGKILSGTNSNSIAINSIKTHESVNIICGPTSCIQDNSPYYAIDTKHQNVKYIQYQNSNSSNTKISLSANECNYLYLNRFINDMNDKYNSFCSALSGNLPYQLQIKLHPSFNIINESNFEYDTSGGPGKAISKSCNFSNVTWICNDGSSTDYPAHELGFSAAQYSFEGVKPPLDFNFDKRRQKLMLGFNPKNEFAEYDSKCWIECGLNFGKYSLNYYNTPGSKGGYINVDDMYKFFFDVHREILGSTPTDTEIKQLKGQLIIYTDTIYPGLVGNRDIQVMNDQTAETISGKTETDLKSLYCRAVEDLTNMSANTFSTSEVLPPLAKPDTISLYGDNSEYTGSIVVDSTVKTIVVYKNSLPHIDNGTGNKLDNTTIYLLGNNKMDLAKYDTNTGSPSTDLNMNLDNTTNTESSGTLEMFDSSNKKITIRFGGDWSKYEGKVTIPEMIKTIYPNFSSDPLFKIKHGNNDDLSGLTYVLSKNLEVDLKNIKNSTLEMSLQSSGKTIKLIDSSNPTKINKVTFSGNNTNYKDSGGTANSGIVELTPYITEVEFINAPNSFVNLKAFNTTKTLLKNNILSSETSKIKVTPPDYNESNIEYTTQTDEMDKVANIWKYNNPWVVWDTSTLANCFSDGPEYDPGASGTEGLLANFPIDILHGVINAKLLGNNDIVTYSTSNPNTMSFLGQNMMYKGIMTIPVSVKNLWFNNDSLIAIKQEGNDKLSNVTFYLLGNNKLDLAKYSDPDNTNIDLDMNLDNTTNTRSSGTLEMFDSNDKKTDIGFGGDWSKYEGKVTIPNKIEKIWLNFSSDPLFKIKHGNNDNLSKLTYVLCKNLEVDLKNIKNSTFEMNLNNRNNEVMKLIDTSNPTKVNKVTFSGNNKN